MAGRTNPSIIVAGSDFATAEESALQRIKDFDLKREKTSNLQTAIETALNRSKPSKIKNGGKSTKPPFRLPKEKLIKLEDDESKDLRVQNTVSLS